MEVGRVASATKIPDIISTKALFSFFVFDGSMSVVVEVSVVMRGEVGSVSLLMLTGSTVAVMGLAVAVVAMTNLLLTCLFVRKLVSIC